MKKFLVFFAVLIGVCNGAWAGGMYYGEQTNPKTDDKTPCILKPSGFADGPYAVYFNTGIDTVSQECEPFFDEVRRELLSINDDVSYFVLIGSADQQGDRRKYDNVALSDRRWDYVQKTIMPNNASLDGRGWVAGSATNKMFEPEYTDDWTFRSVYIYPVPVWRPAQSLSKCTQEFLDKLNGLKQDLTKVNDKYSPQDVQIENKEQTLAEIQNMLTQVEACKAKCPKVGTEWTPEDVDYIQANCILGLNTIINKLPTEVQVELEQTVTTISINTEIDSLYASLKDTIVGLKLSVWRDTEGRFNTARLASDSIAGVVLGTVGGLVTANVVKKNQLKKGFEDINCSVGGQNVAKYGDQMRVGL